MICLSVEGTAHTLGVGIVKDSKILANIKDSYTTKQGGIIPIEAANHHVKVKNKVLEEALKKAKISLDNVDLLAYSAGPGLPPCLKETLKFIKEIKEKTKKAGKW